MEELTTLLDTYGIDYHTLPIRLIQEKIPLKDILVKKQYLSIFQTKEETDRRGYQAGTLRDMRTR